MGETEIPRKTKVSEDRKNDEEHIMFLNPKPLKMVVPVDISSRRKKSTTTMKKSSEKVSTFGKKPYMHAHNIVEPMTVNEGVMPNFTGKNIGHAEINLRKLM